MKLTRHILIAGVLGAALLAPLANAITIDSSTYIGRYNPASTYNNGSDALEAANAIVNWYNGGPDANTVLTDSPQVTVVLNNTGLGILPGSLSLGATDNSDPHLSTFNNTVYTYVIGKFGNTAYLYYLGNLVAGEYSLPADFSPQTTGDGLSHWVTFTVRNPPFLPPPGVPDGGSTAVMLGLALTAMGFAFRRRS